MALAGLVRARCWGRDCDAWILRPRDAEDVQDKLCEECRAPTTQYAACGSPYPATPDSERQYEGGRFASGEW